MPSYSIVSNPAFFRLGDSMNTILNENWPILLEELKPAFEEAIAAIATDIVNKAFQKTPYNDIFAP